MYGINEMYETLKESSNPNFDVERAKIKIATNNSMTLSAKALIQNEIIKATLLESKTKSSDLNHNLLKGVE